MISAKIYVTLKPTVNDPQGITVQNGLHSLGFDIVDSVRFGKYIELNLSTDDANEASKQVDEMCKKLLANPIIEQYRFELDGLSD
ncbi:MAG: phosphoribosylformylglycinamidine synthase subunit PurS [SAR202 cluster bacterium]|nr:phosphoribosylformylglycinamidine synthase subunit PurS [SAR202 cluster bacterium]